MPQSPCCFIKYVIFVYDILGNNWVSTTVMKIFSVLKIQFELFKVINSKKF